MKQATEWTEENIANRLLEAVSIMRRLPAVKVPGYVCAWPKIAYTDRERFQMEGKSTLWPATPEQVTRMEEACQWLHFLINVEDRRLLWLRAERVRWQLICKQFGISRATANRRWKSGLYVITRSLNIQ